MTFLVTLMGLVLFVQSETIPFSLYLSVDGDSFYLLEPIYVKLIIKNTSNSIQKIPDIRKESHIHDFLTYHISDESGKTMRKMGAQWCYILVDASLLRLNPGDSIIFEMSLIDYYGVENRDIDGYAVARWVIPPGKYTCSVTYNFPEDQWTKLKLWRGTVRSNQIVFVVKELPENLKKPYDLYCKILTLGLWKEYKGERYKNKESAIRFAEALIDDYYMEYKGTPYDPLVQLERFAVYTDYFFFCGKTEYKERRVSALKELFEKYPNSPLAQHTLSFMKSVLKTSDKIDEWLPYLEHLSNQYADTRVGNEARRLLQEEKSQK
uniref:Tetratricopeptide repeat protein n=1 Tax=candidate division WOR-3 bacterium TaxID=2052148 RepID=A0A7V0Z737_UNCW3